MVLKRVYSDNTKNVPQCQFKRFKNFLNQGSKKSSLINVLNKGSKNFLINGQKKFLNQGSKKFLIQGFKKVS